MILSSNQAYFLPYFPWWQMINQADLFLIGDDFSFRRHGWVSRNRILVKDEIQYFRLEVFHMSCNHTIGETQVVDINVGDKLRTLEMAYHKAPYFQEGFALCQRIFSCKSDMLLPWLTLSIREVCDYLGITTPLRLTSSFSGNAALKREERIFDLCRRTGADIYVNAIGGQALYDKAFFAANGVELRFIHTDTTENLSIIHSIMHHSREELHDMLKLFHYV